MSEFDVREIEGEDYEFVEAEFVNIKKSSVRSVEGGHVELQQVGALSIDGERVEVTQGAALITRGGDVHLNQCISGITAGTTASLNYSLSQVSLSRDTANINRSAVGLLAAREVKADNTAALMIIANSVEGDVKTLLDWRSALAIGAVAGGIFGLFSLFRRR